MPATKQEKLSVRNAQLRQNCRNYKRQIKQLQQGITIARLALEANIEREIRMEKQRALEALTAESQRLGYR